MPHPALTPSTDWVVSRTHAHYAAQLVAAAGHSLLPADPQVHHSSTQWDAEHGTLLGQALPDGARVGLEVGSLTLTARGQRRSLNGLTVQQGLHWLEQVLGASLHFPEWRLPSGLAIEYGPLAYHPHDHAALAQWFDLAHRVLTAFQPPDGQPSDVWLWPHHFDIARLVTLEQTGDPETDRSVNLGMTPGDAGQPHPYFYVTPWPVPSNPHTPALPHGGWQRDGWVGAILHSDVWQAHGQVEDFLRSAFVYVAAQTQQ